MDFQIERIFKGPGFAETLYLGICDGQRVIRKASNADAYTFSRTALIREIRLLLHLNEELQQFFPEIIRKNLGEEAEDSYDLPDVIYYDMPYFSPGEGWVTLSDCFLDGTIDSENARQVLGGTAHLENGTIKRNCKWTQGGFCYPQFFKSLVKNTYSMK